MKKNIYMASVIAAVVSANTFAAGVDGWDANNSWDADKTNGPVAGTTTDTATAELLFRGDLPYVVGGHYITITGAGGSLVEEGTLEVEKDGTFATLKNITTEVHKFNEASNVTGPILTDSDASEVSWTMSVAPVLSAIKTDVSVATNSPILRLNGKEVSEKVHEEISNGKGTPSEVASVYWGVSNKTQIADVQSGDEFTVQAQVDVAVKF
ncbi:TPA: hypothetical protein ACX6QT_002899 [Photobacterium damselae]|uniref:hypothetical protein n=1 Tax=Photobacterium damselae TaxID=38293 RepID=UPI001F356E8B|nr:hypothetical protein [Photobacterium damselae]UKA08762.1 hypothetical protein IHC90_17290 [Photobacterium damselae subsp. damselae]